MIRLHHITAAVLVAAAVEFIRREWQKSGNWEFVSNGLNWYQCDHETRSGFQCRNQVYVPPEADPYGTVDLVLCAGHNGGTSIFGPVHSEMLPDGFDEDGFDPDFDDDDPPDPWPLDPPEAGPVPRDWHCVYGKVMIR